MRYEFFKGKRNFAKGLGFLSTCRGKETCTSGRSTEVETGQARGNPIPSEPAQALAMVDF